MFKRIVLLAIVVFMMCNTAVYAVEEGLPCKGAILMDFDTGSVLYESNAHEKMAPASITKIMTMILIMEEIEAGNLKYSDMVTASAYAKSMGGSTIFLDEGEIMSVDDLIKGIAVSSGNDACVAMAEHISGSCEEFVKRMNKRAKELGMKNTNFVNCNGLDAEGHYSTAYDIALMSRELMKHDDIFKYTTIWMDSLRGGKFTLSNTNKLVRFYEGCTGLKTGSTSGAGFCLSATAKRDGLHLIAVVMNAPTSKERQAAASKLLNYGFSKYKISVGVKINESVKDISIERGVKSGVGLMCKDEVRFLCDKTSDKSIEVVYDLPKQIAAPVKKGDKAGEALCYVGKDLVGKSDIVYTEDVPKVNFSYAYGKIIDTWLGNKNQF